MGKNKGKGGKSFRSGKKDRTDTRRALVYKETFAEEEGADGAPQVCESHFLYFDHAVFLDVLTLFVIWPLIYRLRCSDKAAR